MLGTVSVCSDTDAKRLRHPNYQGGESRRNERLPFVAWDGEGYTDSNGEHHYYLFGCSDGDYISNPSGLSAIDCFELMLKVAARRKAIHVIYAGTYDITMMIHRYPTAIATRITRGNSTWWDGYRHEWFKGKYLKLGDGQRHIILYDVFTFFACSFVKALREYLGDNEDFDRIEEVKLQRDTFTIDDLETKVIPYWRQELVYLVKLVEILRTRMLDADIPISQYHGPGAVASAILKSRGIKAHMATTPEPVRDAARHAYYGGRFEQFKIGLHEGPVYQYDIRSAYPSAIALLPSLAGVPWINKQRDRRYINNFGLYKVSWTDQNYRSYHFPGPLPWRDDDRAIYYPHEITESWYWGIEIADLYSGKDSKHGKLTIHEAWEPQLSHTSYPFGFVRDMYNERARMKAEGDPTQLALKLGLNSLYGKLAQSKGARLRDGKWQIPAYHQLEWAGWITARTRAILRRALWSVHSDHIIACETDAVYATCELPTLDIGDGLGQWEAEQFDAIMYIQSGVYFKRKKGKWTLKSRGFEPRNHSYENWRRALSKLPAKPDTVVTMHVRRFGTIPGTTNYARWYEQERHSSIVGHAKRVHYHYKDLPGGGHLWAGLCEACNHPTKTFTQQLHRLVFPFVTHDHIGTVPSKAHQLPWIDEGMKGWDEEFWVTEDGFMTVDFGADE